MAQHLLLGYPENKTGTPSVIYLGSSGEELEAARKSDTKSRFHRIIKNLDGVGYRKNNDPTTAPEPAKRAKRAKRATRKS